MPNANNLELNKGDQFIIALDISGSMGNTDCPGDMSRIDYTLETIKTFVAEADKWDADGVSFYPFGATVHAYRDMKAVDIDAKLKNIKLEGATMTHLAVAAAYKEHKEKNNEQTFLMIFTDGEPSDHDKLKQAIIDVTKDVKDEKEFEIVFITVGVRSPALAQFLTDLDDNLKSMGAKYDIVSCFKLEDVDFVKACSTAVSQAA